MPNRIANSSDIKPRTLGYKFHLAWIISLLVSVAAFHGTLKGLELHPCWSKECLEFAVDTFMLPLKILFIGILVSTLMLTIRRAEQTNEQIQLGFNQLERQITQDKATSAIQLNKSFSKLVEEAKAIQEFNILIVNSEWLFHSLYPDIWEGKFVLDEKFKTQVMNPLINEFNQLLPLSHDHARMRHVRGYDSFLNLYSSLTKTIPCSTSKSIIRLDRGGIFSKSNPEVVNFIELLKDLTKLITIINSFEGWKYFSFEDALKWEDEIENLRRQSNFSKIVEDNSRSLCHSDKSQIIQWISYGCPESTGIQAAQKILSIAKNSIMANRALLYELLYSSSSFNEEEMSKIKISLNLPEDYRLSGLFPVL